MAKETTGRDRTRKSVNGVKDIASDCRICSYAKSTDLDYPKGYKVQCIPPDYWGTQASRLIPNVVDKSVCSRFRLSERKLEEAIQKARKELEKLEG